MSGMQALFRHRWVVAGWLLIALLRGLFWVAVSPIWNPIDEAHHFAYIESIATGQGIPNAAEDYVSDDVLRVAKDSPTLPYRSQPLSPSKGDAGWDIYLYQYEAVQGPVYYLASAPVYLASRWAGIYPSIYALRIWGLLLSLLTIPLTMLIARELFEEHEAVWLMSPALLIVGQGFSHNLTYITNDSLAVPLTAAAMLAILKGAKALDKRRALVAGGALGLAMLTKMTAIQLIPIMGLAILMLGSFRTHKMLDRLRWGLIVGAAALAVLVPYFVRNAMVYGDLGATGTISDTTAAAQPRIALDADGVREHLANARIGFWQSYPPGPGRTYGLFLGLSVIASGLLGMWASRRHRGAGLVSVWLLSQYLLAVATMIALVYLVFSGMGTVFGRHVYTALPAMGILWVAGCVLTFGSRVAAPVLLAVASIAFYLEAPVTMAYINEFYGSATHGGLVPSIDQSYNERVETIRTIAVRPPCAAEWVGFWIGEAAPSAIRVNKGTTSVVAAQVAFDGTRIPLYKLPRPTAEPFTMMLGEGMRVGHSVTERQQRLSSEANGDPVARIYCRQKDPKATRFDQLFRKGHIDAIDLGVVRFGAWVWMWLSLAMFVIASAIVFRRRTPG